ncbi:MAG: hypothetical protein KDB61_02280 [Planctomycetes bacterium]|nr:hypothetical protein [Planctomycetota bacterium]
MRNSVVRIALFAALASLATAQAPEIIHYTFDSGDASNTATGTVGDGTVTASITFGASANCGSGMSAVSGGSSQLDSNWAMDLGTGDWTVGMHLNHIDSSTGTQYFFGSQASGGFRCFSGGVAGVNGIMLRTLMGGDVTIAGGAPIGSSHVVWVHDSSVPEVRGYLDGVLQLTVPQTSPGSGLVSATADFKVMTYTTPMRSGNSMDDFRFYRRAISDAEVAAWAQCAGGGTGTPFCSPGGTNSTGTPAFLSGTFGSGVGSDLHLEVTGGPPGQLVYILAGNEATSGVAISNGTFCLIGTATAQTYPFSVAGTDMNSISGFDATGTMANASGTSTTGFGFDVPSTLPGIVPITIMAGDTWHFQSWYRDTQAGVGQSNFSNGLSVTF